jgi:hypothetical protein
MTASTLTIIGLTLDLAGVLLLFKYGLPDTVSRTGTFVLKLGDDPKVAAKAAFYDTMSWVALLFVVVGYGLQVYAAL